MIVRRALPWVILCVAVGMLASFIQNDSLQNWYPYLNKSSLTPPDWVFPVVWTTLYVFMGISIALARMSMHPARRTVTGIFIAQLVLNFFWSIAFFYMRSPEVALAIIVALLLLLLLYIRASWPLSRAAAYLFVPYAFWVAFATYLNLYVVMHN